MPTALYNIFFHPGSAYHELLAEDEEKRQYHLKHAIACYQASLEVYTLKDFPLEHAASLNNCGSAYRELTHGNRRFNLERAIACYEAALQALQHVPSHESDMHSISKNLEQVRTALQDLS